MKHGFGETCLTYYNGPKVPNLSDSILKGEITVWLGGPEIKVLLIHLSFCNSHFNVESQRMLL